MPKLVVPERFQRNSSKVRTIDPEETGAALISLACERLGLRDLAASDVLDVGCGVRFTQTILNRGLPLRSYTGVDVDRDLMDWMRKEVRDPRFRFAAWDVRNPMYNKRAAPMTRDSKLPVAGDFDVIWLFSVFTHMPPADSDAMLAILRRHVRPTGRLFFSCFIDDAVGTFADRTPERPALHATYAERTMRDLLAKNGWEALALHPKDDARFIQHHFVCAPKA